MKKALFLFLLGAFSALSMAPYNIWPALCVGLCGLYICVARCPSVKKSFLLGFMFSLGYFTFSLYWIGNALLVEDNPYWWAWPFAVIGLPAILAPFTATFCAIFKIIKPGHSINLSGYILFCTLLSVADFCRGTLFTGFPWNLYAYTWIGIPQIAQVASLWNVYLLNSLTILWLTLPALLLNKNTPLVQKYFMALFVLAGIVASFMYGSHKTRAINPSSSPDTSFIIVQPNILQAEKWKPENRVPNFQHLIDLSKFNVPTENDVPDTIQHIFVIWPETAISQDLLNAPWVMSKIADMLNTYPHQATLIAGALRYDGKNAYNSVIAINNQGKITETYDKSHLVPFGEYMPFDNILKLSPIVGFTGFKPGTEKKEFAFNNIKIKPLICYEIIFPDLFRIQTQQTFVVNVTNDAWYGDSAGPQQHLVQTQFRAIEKNTIVLRAANTGVSAAINKDGSIISKIKYNHKGIISASF